MKGPTIHKDLEPPGESTVNNQADFSTLYDQYAPSLLGVIIKIIPDKSHANTLLEVTFRKIRSEMGQFNPRKQPLFAWLLNIARSTALESLNEHRQLPALVVQFTESGKVVALHENPIPEPTRFVVNTTNPQFSELLDSILFKNCTPEEAALSVGLPVESVRQQLRLSMQQLRLAMQQLRTSAKG